MSMKCNSLKSLVISHKFRGPHCQFYKTRRKVTTDFRAALLKRSLKKTEESLKYHTKNGQMTKEISYNLNSKLILKTHYGDTNPEVSCD